jgi:predicted lipoprotein with Yx(FWY)xxD motif
MRRAARMVLMLLAGTTGAGLAVLVGVAVAKSFTLSVTKNAKVTNFMSSQPHTTKSESIVTALGGSAVYTLSGDSKSHPKCVASNGCFAIWPPVTIAAGKKATKAPGVKGKLTTWKRNGFTQLVLAGHPLYFFAGDGTKKRVATGQAIMTFGGTWHVVAVDPATAKTVSTSGPAPTTPTYPTTPTTPTTPTPPYWG